MKDTKEFILESAYEMFLRHNYEAVTMSKISKVTKLTKGAIYHHYASKEELFKAVVDKYLIESKEITHKKNVSLQELIQQSIAELKNKISSEHRNKIDLENTSFLHHISFMLDSMQYYPSFNQIACRFYKHSLSQWKNCIENAIKSGEIRGDIDTEAMSINFLSISYGIASNMILMNSIDFAFEMYKRQMEELYKLLKNN